MRTLKQNVSIRSQSALIIFMVAIGWLLGGSFDIHLPILGDLRWGIVDIFCAAIPIFTLLLLVSYFVSGRQHKGWFFAAVAAVVISFVLGML